MVRVLEASHQKQAIIPDDRRRVPGAGNRNFPEHVLARLAIPGNWNVTFHARPITARPAPTRPLLRAQLGVCVSKASQADESDHGVTIPSAEQ